MNSNRKKTLFGLLIVLVIVCAVFIINNDLRLGGKNTLTGRAVTELTDDTGAVVGRKVVDDPRFETRIIGIERTQSALKVRFSHDAAQPLPIWVEGNATYTFSVLENAPPNDTITLTVLLENSRIPSFRLHIGAESEIFEFFESSGTFEEQGFSTQGFSVQSEPGSNCTVVNISTSLSENVLSNASCFLINASNLVFNCSGYSIGGNYSGVGINATSVSNITIKDCLVENFSTNIWMFYAHNSNVRNTTAWGASGDSIAFTASDNTSIRNVTSTSTGGAGVLVNTGKNVSIIEVIAISTTGRGILVASTNSTRLVNATGISTSQAGIFIGLDDNATLLDTRGISQSNDGIAFSQSLNGVLTQASGRSTAAGRGIVCDICNYFRIENSSARSNSSYAISLVTAYNNVLVNVTGNSTYAAGIGLSSSNYNTVRNSRSSAGSLYGMYLNPSNYNNITNNTFCSATVGMSLNGDSNNTIAFNTFCNNVYGLIIDSQSADNRIENNSFNNNTNTGCLLQGGSSLNRFWGNNVSNSTSGIKLSGNCAHNTIANNTVLDNTVGIRLESGASYNLVENNTLITNTEAGIRVDPTASLNNLSRNVFISNLWGTILAGGNDNLISNTNLNGTRGSLNITATMGSTTGFNNSILNSAIYANSTYEMQNGPRGPAILTFTTDISFASIFKFSDLMNISYNYVFVNATISPWFNQPATIQLFNLFFNPIPMIDVLGNNVFQNCSGNCTIIYSGPGYLAFNVSGFSAFKAEDAGPAVCTVNITSDANATYNDTIMPNVTNSSGAGGLGRVIAGGDFNNDGQKDIVAGAPNAPADTSTPDAGKVYIIFGVNPFVPSGNITNVANVTLSGNETDELLGTAVAIGDLNNDSIDDLVVGSAGSHAVYVFFGRENMTNTALTKSNANITVNVSSVEDLSLAIGDLNNDTVNDLIIGQVDYAENNVPVGRVDVIFGSPLISGTIHAPFDSNATFNGTIANAYFGYSLAAGDINNDSVSDLIIGSPGLNVSGVEKVGVIFIFFGGNGFTSKPLISADAMFPGISSINGIANTFALTGFSLSAGQDVNNDSSDDLLIGAPRSNAPPDKEDAGTVYIVFGSPAVSGIISLSNANVTLYGTFGNALGMPPGERAGYSVFATDLTADGIADVNVGAPRAYVNNLLDAGIVYQLYGRQSWPRYMNLTSTNKTVCAVEEGSLLGYALGDPETGLAKGEGGEPSTTTTTTTTTSGSTTTATTTTETVTTTAATTTEATTTTAATTTEATTTTAATTTTTGTISGLGGGALGLNDDISTSGFNVMFDVDTHALAARVGNDAMGTDVQPNANGGSLDLDDAGGITTTTTTGGGGTGGPPPGGGGGGCYQQYSCGQVSGEKGAHFEQPYMNGVACSEWNRLPIGLCSFESVEQLTADKAYQECCQQTTTTTTTATTTTTTTTTTTAPTVCTPEKSCIPGKELVISGKPESMPCDNTICGNKRTYKCGAPLPVFTPSGQACPPSMPFEYNLNEIKAELETCCAVTTITTTTTAKCGNYDVEEGEDCDPPGVDCGSPAGTPAKVEAGVCSDECKCMGCGDGFVQKQFDEYCDYVGIEEACSAGWDTNGKAINDYCKACHCQAEEWQCQQGGTKDRSSGTIYKVEARDGNAVEKPYTCVDAAAAGAPANVISECCGCFKDTDCPPPPAVQNLCWNRGEGCCDTGTNKCAFRVPGDQCDSAEAPPNKGAIYKSSALGDCMPAAPDPYQQFIHGYYAQDACTMTFLGVPISTYGATCEQDCNVNCDLIGCPPGSKNPNCPCPPPSIGTYPNCQCPPGSVGIPPLCTCPPGTTGMPPNCVQCPPGATLPNCPCPAPATGTYPNCVCPPGTYGSPPFCTECPPGVMYPGCPCPEGALGVQLRCRCPPGMTGVPPNCECPPGETCPELCEVYGTCPPPECPNPPCDIVPPTVPPPPLPPTLPPTILTPPVVPPYLPPTQPPTVPPVVPPPPLPPPIYCADWSTGQGDVSFGGSSWVNITHLPEGYEVITTQDVTCNRNYIDLTVNIPDNFIDVRAFLRYRAGGDVSMKSDVSNTAMCGNQAVSTTRNQQITGWAKPNMTYEELRVTGIVQEVIAPTDAERIVQSGRYSIELLKQLSGSTIVRLSSPTFDVPQPSHPNLVIIGTPMLVTINPPYIGKVRVRMPYEVPDFIDPNSISLYVRVGGSQWKYLDSQIDQENRTVWADVNDVSLFLDNANSAIFAVMGITCLNCQKIALDRIYDGGSRKAVFLVHGFTTDALRWQAFIDDLVHTNSDWQVWTVSYPLSMDSDSAASELSSIIEQRASEFDKISFIMHSMGGIITQKALKNGNENNYAWPKKVMDLILVGQPGLGSPSADVYGRLFATLVNIRSSVLVWDQHSPLLSEAVNGLQVQRSPDAEYFVIAGRQSYPFTYELFKTNESYLPNDGIISIFSARTVGGEQITDSCKHYFEVPRTHTDLLDDWLPRKIMQRVLFRRDALENPDGIIAGYNKYVHIVEEDCRPGTIVIIGRRISEAETEDPLNCNCGNGVCGEGESELNCPQDCVTGYKYYYMCRVMPWVLGPLVALLVLLATIYVYHAISKHERGEGAFWIMMISIIVVLLMLGMYLLCGFTMPLGLLVMVFVLAILSFTIGHLHAEHKNGKKANHPEPKHVFAPVKRQKQENMPVKMHKPEKEAEITLIDGNTLKKLEKLFEKARGR